MELDTTEKCTNLQIFNNKTDDRIINEHSGLKIDSNLEKSLISAKKLVNLKPNSKNSAKVERVPQFMALYWNYIREDYRYPPKVSNSSNNGTRASGTKKTTAKTTVKPRSG